MFMAELRGAVASVEQGLNGRLFLGRQDGFDLEQFCGGEPLDRDILLRWRDSLARRGQEMVKRGIPYVFFIVPDAPSVYPEDLPRSLAKRLRPPGEVFLEAMGDIEGVTFVYPLAELRGAKGGLEVYRKTDSHWTSYGSYIGYRSLMRVAGQLVHHAPVRAVDLQFSLRKSYGDLGCQMQPEQSEEIPISSILSRDVKAARQFDGVGRLTATESSCDGTGVPRKALFFRDSFMTDLAPYVARSFSDLLTIGSTTRVLMDAVDDWGAHLVVSEVAERKLGFYETDHQLEGFEALYSVDYKSVLGKRLLQARIMLASDPAAAASLIRDDAHQFGGNAGQAFSAALVFEAAGLIDLADDLARCAVRLRPSQGSYLALAARTSLACGQTKQAADFAEASVIAAPFNGYFHELYVYCLLQIGKQAAALKAAETALAHMEDHPNLFYWASVLHASATETEMALSRIRCATKLDPVNPAYREQLLRVCDSVAAE